MTGRDPHPANPEPKPDLTPPNGAQSGNNGDGTSGSGDNAQANVHPISLGARVAETPAQHAAAELKDSVASHQDTGPHDVLKDAAARVEATVHAAAPLVHGVNLEDSNHFADFIKAAQTPVQSGLMASLQPAGPDALHHDSAPSGLGHQLGSDDLHAMIAVHAAPVAVMHDSAVEHHAAPVSVEALWHH
jgi:hypothetical protein